MATAPTGTAKLFVLRPEQIADFARVQVNADADFWVESPERIAALVVNGGAVITTSNGPVPPGILTVGSLAMTGGTVETSGNVAQLRLEGDVTATSNAAGPAVLRRSNNSEGTLDLGGATRTFTVNQGPSTTGDLDISLKVVATGDVGITKDGAGRMRFSGAVDNTYTGVTTVRQGRLELAKTGYKLSVRGSLQIGAGAGPVVVEEKEAHNIYDKASVSVADQSTHIVNGDQVWGGLAVGSGSRVEIGPAQEVGPRASNLTLAGGRIVVAGDSMFNVDTGIIATSTAGRPAVIEGAGSFSFLGAQPIFVLDGPEAIDFGHHERLGIVGRVMDGSRSAIPALRCSVASRSSMAASP